MIKDIITRFEAEQFPVELPGHYIAGEWGFSAETLNTFESICPSTGVCLATSKTSKSDVKNAINCAYEYHLGHLDVPFEKRIERIASFTKIFKAHEKEITRIAIREQGKPLWEVSHEFKATLDYLEWVSQSENFIKDQLLGPARLGHLTGSFKQKPAGVIAAYLPFSTTLTTFGFYYVASVLANCPVVMFSSQHNLLQSTLFAAIENQSSAEAGAFQMVLAGFSDFKMALGDRRINAVLYTGSRDHCDEIREDSSSFPERRLILQSGGKNTLIISETADMNLAVNSLMQGAFRSSGQLCSSTNRAVVHESRYAEFKKTVNEALKKMTIGPTHTTDYNPFMGPLFSEKAVQRFLRYQTMAAREAEESISWGKAFTPPEKEALKGFYVKPGIHLMKSMDDTSYQKSVIVCPDVAVYKYQNIEAAIKEIVNHTHASFAVSYFGDKSELDQYAHMMEASNILHNLPTTEVEACLPLAGRYASGFHRFHGPSIAHYLLHPTAYQEREELEDKISKWPQLI